MTNQPDALHKFGAQVDFGRAANDYATHRAGFPTAFFDLISSRGYAVKGQRALDLGTGTGTVARGLALMGLVVTGRDPAPELLLAAQDLDRSAGTDVRYDVGKAEQTEYPDRSFDLITAGQCWHWFDRPRAAQEARRLLTLDGRLLIAHFDWLPHAGNVVEATEALILQHNANWAGAGGNGIYPAWLDDLSDAGFTNLETVSFDISQTYSHTAWRGRIRASAGIKASLSAEDSEAFDRELHALLRDKYPQDPLAIPHRVWLATGRGPSGSF